jgi:hypothetical protein
MHVIEIRRDKGCIAQPHSEEDAEARQQRFEISAEAFA